MIDEKRTFEKYGYTSDELTPQSHKRIVVVCEKCNKIWDIRKGDYKDHGLCHSCAMSKGRIGKYTGEEHWNFGKHPTEETLKKQSESHIGLQSGEDNPMYGKKHPEETIQKMKISHEGQVGENASNWQGGITSENDKFRNSIYYTIWRTSVFERDDYTCQDCGQKGSILNAHHILPYTDWRDPKISLNIDNGITLCEDCHKLIRGKEYDYANKYFNTTFDKEVI